jgi:hypothetical protein
MPPLKIDDDVVEGKVVKDDPANVKDQPAATVVRSEFDRKLIAQQEVVGETAEDPYERIIRQVLAADSADVVLTPTEVFQARDLLNQNIVIIDFELNQSEFDAGSPFYATMAVLKSPDDPPMVVNCGHKKVLAQLVRLKELGAFPIQVKFITRGTSKVGGTPMLEMVKWEYGEQPAPF